jgi:hypothetical protein
MHNISRRSSEETANLLAGLVLCHLEDGNEGRLAAVSKPDLATISQHRHYHCLENPLPSEKGETSDRVP